MHQPRRQTTWYCAVKTGVLCELGDEYLIEDCGRYLTALMFRETEKRAYSLHKGRRRPDAASVSTPPDYIGQTFIKSPVDPTAI